MLKTCCRIKQQLINVFKEHDENTLESAISDNFWVPVATSKWNTALTCYYCMTLKGQLQSQLNTDKGYIINEAFNPNYKLGSLCNEMILICYRHVHRMQVCVHAYT